MSETKEKILVLQENSATKRSRWSIRRYLTEIKRFKWWVLGSTLVASAAGAFALEFGYNHSKRTVLSTFSLSLPYFSVSDNGQLGKVFVLYNGSPLATSEIFSLSSIQEVIKSDDAFSRLDADAISKSLSFSVLGNQVGGVFVGADPFTASMTLRYSSFTSLDQARAFVVKLAERPLNVAKSALSSYSSVEAIYDGFNDLDYIEQASLLADRAQSIKETYESLIRGFLPSFLSVDEKTTIGAVYEKFCFSHASSFATDAEVAFGEVSDRNYLKFSNTPEGRSSKIAELKGLGGSLINNVKKTISELSSLKETYDRLAATTQIVTTDTTLTDKMLKLIDEISAKQATLDGYLSTLKRIGYVSGSTKDILELSTVSDANSIRLGVDLEECGGYVQHLQSPTVDGWADSCVAFGAKMGTLRDSYAADINTVNDNFRYMQSRYGAFVHFSIPAIIDVTGGFNLFLGILAGFLLGFAASSVICTFVGIWKEDRSEEALKAK